MKAIILDTETTGTQDPIPIEVAWIEYDPTLRGERRRRTYSERFNPGKAISFGAMATHMILDSEVVGCRPFSEFRLPYVEYVIGHKVDFDWGAIERSWPPDLTIPKRICTLALARKYWPDLDSHTLSACVLYLHQNDLNRARALLVGSHSAGRDCLNCEYLVHYFYDMAAEQLGNDRTHEEILAQLYKISEDARVPDKITFGKYAGTPIKDLPPDYVAWLLKQDWLDYYLKKALEKFAEKDGSNRRLL